MSVDNFTNPDPQESKLFDYQEEARQNMAHYRQILSYMGANVPIQVLCLPKEIETLLVKDGCQRVYDLMSRDLSKIKGLGVGRLSILTARLDEFFTVDF